MVRNLTALLHFLFFQAVLGNPLLEPTNQGRIVGGKTAPEGRFPYIASLRLNGKHFCGASILSSEWLVTAAHCFVGVTEKTVVVVGTNKLNQGGKAYRIMDSIIHERYSEANFSNDIGLIRVFSITFNEKVQPISVYARFMPAEVDITIAGWGRLSKDGVIPNDLQFLEVKSISVEDCKLLVEIDESTLCTFSRHGEGTCQGDSGGPVVTTNENGEDILTGLVSWVVPCAVGYPDGHTRVYSYISWIKGKCNNCIN